ncbi:hypothetical protein CY34DRAFT_80297 [Suillus luteus UH-Slu-Lm8-n1]|uniref:CxC5 like cysteine cluster associated with KDZ domain-containing protein n=1 Tax=Suillus luteus UH-Slu-Lm8-n1 TaxID=930992 RepID=A0A0D0BDF6_9AGAM|nr:hypothetical protein CY34DRAFT_80297 [Suillus luteus UH-Slu-Lm8-n1]
MDVISLLSGLCDDPELAGLPYLSLMRFIYTASLIKDDILLPQPHTVSTSLAPHCLPPSITEFLGESFGLSQRAVCVLWHTVKDVVWTIPSKGEEQEIMETIFRHHGQPHGIAAHVLYPPMKMCVNPECLAHQKQTLLKKEEARCILIFTQSDGVHCTWTVHLRCKLCNTNYHYNYGVHQGSRTYYAAIPKYIQVAEHQFVELALVMHWMDLMRVQCVVSATNCARLYNEAQARRNTLTHDWPFKMSVTTEEVWDAFIILALLDDHQRQGTRLCVPHGNNQSDRFTAAMQARNEKIITHGNVRRCLSPHNKTQSQRSVLPGAL